jgi:signal peptide peptidase SppA
MSTELIRIADRVLNRPLMILPDKLALIATVLEGRIGIDASEFKEKDFEAMLREGPSASRFIGDAERVDPNNPRSQIKYTVSNGVAIINVLGSLVNRGAWLGAASGMTSYEGLAFQIEDAGRNPKVTSIILDIDSPGGEAVGAFEIADKVRSVAKSKNVTAVVNGMAASAAYAIASAANTIVSTGSGVSGSIGVVLMHADYSGRLQQKGIRPTLIHAGAHKVDGHPYEPLPDSVRADLQAEVDQFYSLFVSSVAKGRKGRMTENAVRSTEARTYIGKAALEAGLVDAIGGFETVLADLSRGGARPAPKRPSSGLSIEVIPTAPAVASPTVGISASSRTVPAVLNAPTIGGPWPTFSTTADDIVAAAAALHGRDQTVIASNWSDAQRRLSGRSATTVSPGWEAAIAKANGTIPLSGEPGHGWMVVIAKVNTEGHRTGPLADGWQDVVGALNGEKPNATEFDQSWAVVVAQVNAGAIR